MRRYDTLTTLDAPGGTCVALGYFDGVHLGHRQVIGRAVQAARQLGCQAAVFTFAPPLDKAVKGRAILTQAEKERRIGALGVQHYMHPAFEEFRDLTPEDFVHQVLARQMGAKAVFCGENFTFGSHKAGNVATLQALCAPLGIRVETVPLVEWQGDTVSSTRIRACLEAGDIPGAEALLGGPYVVDLPVRHGQRLGTQLGFPTINQVFPPHMLLPRQGVYVTRVSFADGTVHPGATGLGSRPTVNGQGITCETFMPGFSGDVYGDVASVRFCQFLWPTQKYDTLQDLSAMVQKAAQAALDWQAEQ